MPTVFRGFSYYYIQGQCWGRYYKKRLLCDGIEHAIDLLKALPTLWNSWLAATLNQGTRQTRED